MKGKRTKTAVVAKSVTPPPKEKERNIVHISQQLESESTMDANSIPSKLQKKVRRILDVLNHYYPDPPVPLNHSNDFTFLVAVVLSAQTTDGKVNEVTRILFQHADNPYDMAKLAPSFVQSIIQPVGLAPRKAQYVVGLAKEIVQRFDGKVPNTYEDLESLPGVGHKTASVIMSQLHGVSALAVDTHVHRLALRWGLSKDARNVDKVQADLCKAFPEESWNKAHLQMIYFGREYCPAKNHQPKDCPVCSWVNQSLEETEALVDYQSFSPSKRAKGLVYYSDRVDELKVDPSLAKFSPPPPSSSSKKIVVKQEVLLGTKTSLDFSQFEMTSDTTDSRNSHCEDKALLRPDDAILKKEDIEQPGPRRIERQKRRLDK